MTTSHEAFELGMHATFKHAGVTTRADADRLFKVAGEILKHRQATHVARAAFELGLRKVAADNGLLTTEEQDAFVESAKKVAAEKKAAEKVAGCKQAFTIRDLLLGAGLVGGLGAGAGAGIGGVQGAMRKKSPGEGRGHSIARSAGTGAATGLGALAGTAAGTTLAQASLAGVPHSRSGAAARLALVLGGALGGGSAGHLLARRGAEKKAAEKRAILGLGTTAGEDARNIGKGAKGLVAKLREKIKKHPTISAALAAGAAGTLVGSRLQKGRDQGKLAAAAGMTPEKISLIMALLGTAGTTAVGSGVGQVQGTLRPKDKGESRIGAILRSQGTGAATGLGVGAGASAGALGAAKMKGSVKARLLSALAGGALGGGAAHKLTKRTPNPPGVLARVKDAIKPVK